MHHGRRQAPVQVNIDLSEMDLFLLTSKKSVVFTATRVSRLVADIGLPVTMQMKEAAMAARLVLMSIIIRSDGTDITSWKEDH